MVKGLAIFKKHFAPYHDKYVLIGGTACSLVMEEAGVSFRATKDLDIVLCIEALNKEFVFALKEFVKQGGYQNRQQSTGKDVFYRFSSPNNKDFPAMLEHQLLSIDNNVILPLQIENDLREFFQRIEKDSIDLKTLDLKNTTYEKILNNLKVIYNISHLP